MAGRLLAQRMRQACPVTDGPRVLMIVPTLGTRTEYLRQTLASIAGQDVPADLVVVTPTKAAEARALAAEFGAQVVDDPGSLPGAINAGAALLAPRHEFVNWLGDDDLLEPGSLRATTQLLDAQPGAVLAYGACRYIDSAGRELWVSQAGKWAPRILKWGPDLIPQPGMLVRAGAWRAVGGVDESLSMVFDLDLLLKLQRIGTLADAGVVVSCFRWHADSLTAGDRSRNLDEGELTKRRYLSPMQQRLRWLWEKPVRGATRVAAWEVHRRARRLGADSASGERA